jgi:hypothetical protein
VNSINFRPLDGTRFVDMPVSFLLIATYAGDPEMILVWLARAMAEREEAGLGLPPRDPIMLAATVGVDLEDFNICTRLLIRDGWLTNGPDGVIRVPWGKIYMSSVEAASQLAQHVAALRAQSIANAPAPTQQPLDLS